jgi:hypothetical protein
MADNRFGLFSSVSRRPGRIHIRCVDRVETLVNKGIKHADACLFIDRLTEDIASGHEWCNVDPGPSELTISNFQLLFRWGNLIRGLSA